MSRHGSKAHKQRMSVVPVKLVPKPFEMMPDGKPKKKSMLMNIIGAMGNRKSD